TIPVREGEELAPDKLKKFLNENLSDTPEGDLVVEQFGAGHSNLTYLLKIGDWEAVLRRPPLGPDRKSTRLNSSHVSISYAFICITVILFLLLFPTRRSSDLPFLSEREKSLLLIN